MSTIAEVLRLKYDAQLSHERIARAVGLSKGAVSKYVAAAGVSAWPLPDDLDKAALERRLYPPSPDTFSLYLDPDWFEVHQELKRKGVTLTRLHAEHVADRAHRYSQFAQRYRQWRAAQNKEHTPAARGRRQGLHRSHRAHRRRHRSAYRRGPPRADLRRLELHVRRGDVDAEPAELEVPERFVER